MKLTIKSFLKKIPLLPSVYRRYREIINLDTKIKTSVELMEYRIDKLYSYLMNKAIIIGDGQIFSPQETKVIYATHVTIHYADQHNKAYEITSTQCSDDLKAVLIVLQKEEKPL